jgi:hypothetical protein
MRSMPLEPCSCSDIPTTHVLPDGYQGTRHAWTAPLVLSRRPRPQVYGWDHMMRMALEALQDCTRHRWLLSRFVYSSTIINLSLGPCVDDDQIRSAYPEAYLAHYNVRRCKKYKSLALMDSSGGHLMRGG